MKFEEIITKRTILRKLTQESFDSIYSDMSQDEQLEILGITSIEELLKNTQDLKGKQKENVENFGAQGLLSKELATISLEVPVEFDEVSLK